MLAGTARGASHKGVPEVRGLVVAEHVLEAVGGPAARAAAALEAVGGVGAVNEVLLAQVLGLVGGDELLGQEGAGRMGAGAGVGGLGALWVGPTADRRVDQMTPRAPSACRHAVMPTLPGAPLSGNEQRTCDSRAALAAKAQHAPHPNWFLTAGKGSKSSKHALRAGGASLLWQAVRPGAQQDPDPKQPPLLRCANCKKTPRMRGLSPGETFPAANQLTDLGGACCRARPRRCSSLRAPPAVGPEPWGGASDGSAPR